MRCTKLRRLYVNSNQINLHGLPRGIFNLEKLEVFSAADNNLETIPDALCRLGGLKVLNLNKNRLLTLPEAVHFLQLKVSRPLAAMSLNVLTCTSGGPCILSRNMLRSVQVSPHAR